MKVLILGGSGMLGHKLWQRLAPDFDTYVVFRGQPEDYRRFDIFDESRAHGGLRAEDPKSAAAALAQVSPDVVVNCVGIVKQDSAAKDPEAAITVNALFPHWLARLCCGQNARLIHLSTDCVFSGSRGNYSETDRADAEDLYGRTKFLGEVDRPNCLTLRTSMIGRELVTAHGLIEWFFSQERKTIRGFKRAIFSGFTTLALAEMLARIIKDHSGLSGIYHLAAQPISKYHLLLMVKEYYGVSVEIEPDDTFVCDRSLDGTRFRERTGLTAPSWSEMIQQMYEDPTPYQELRRADAQR